MEIIEQSKSRLVYQDSFNNPARRASSIILLLMTGIPLVMITTGIYQAGTTTLKCDRVEPTLIACQVKRTRAFGLLAEDFQTLGRAMLRSGVWTRRRKGVSC